MKCNNILEAIGHTPAGAPESHQSGAQAADLCEGRLHQSGRLGERPHRHHHDRRRRKKRPAEARRHHHRRHFGQYRHGSGAGRRGAQLQNGFHHHRQAIQGKSGSAEGAGRRSDRVPHGSRAGRSAQLLFGGQKTGARNSQFLLSESVRQSDESRSPLPAPPARKSGKTAKAKSRTSSAAWAPAARSAAWAAT